jgi:hypothetical protein
MSEAEYPHLKHARWPENGQWNAWVATALGRLGRAFTMAAQRPECVAFDLEARTCCLSVHPQRLSADDLQMRSRRIVR